MTFRYCPVCRDVQVFEQPPCSDGHAECPEWICLGCDSVIVAGWVSDDVQPAAYETLAGAA